jgi:hypothetical protein
MHDSLENAETEIHMARQPAITRLIILITCEPVDSKIVVIMSQMLRIGFHA